MKERLSNVLAWFAFIHGGFCVMGVGMALLNDKRMPDFFDFYFELVGFEVLEVGVLLYSPLVWVLLYVINGNPRFFPWVK